MLTNWHTLLRNEAHTLAGQALSAIQLTQHNGCTWETACARAANTARRASLVTVGVSAGKYFRTSFKATLRACGIDITYSCEEGVCGACETTVLSGTPDHRDSILTESERQASKTMMVCCSGSKSDRLVLDL
jgi:ferredoxin